MHYRHLALVRELIDRGADVNKRGSATVGLLTYGLLNHDLSKVGDMDKYSKRLYVFVLMLLLRGPRIENSPAKTYCACGVWSSTAAPDPVVARRAPPIRSSAAS